MFRLSQAPVCCFWVICIAIFAQPANAQDKTWRKYDLRSIEIPPPNVVPDNAPIRDTSAETFVKDHSLSELVQRGVEGTRITLFTPKSISVHSTPDIQQQIAVNIAHLQRPETKNDRFVMEINYLTLENTQEYRTNNSKRVLWKENQYGPLTVGTGIWEALPEKIETGAELPISPYLHPVLGRKNTTTCAGVNFYYVAKKNIPQMLEAWHEHIHNLKEDSRFCDHFRSQPVITSNGQLGINMEDVSFPFTLTHPEKWYKSTPPRENIPADKVFTSVSVISVDGKTVTSDIDIRFPQFPKRPSAKSPPALIPIFAKNAKGSDNSRMDYLTISEKNLIWPADGMLVVLMSGIPLIAEGKIEKKESGVPLLNTKRVYSLAEHPKVQTLTGILTIRMVSPNEIAQAATAPATIRY